MAMVVGCWKVRDIGQLKVQKIDHVKTFSTRHIVE